MLGLDGYNSLGLQTVRNPLYSNKGDVVRVDADGGVGQLQQLDHIIS